MAQIAVTFKGEKGEVKGFETTDAVEIDGTSFPRNVAVSVDAVFGNQIRDDAHGWYSTFKFGFEDVPGEVEESSTPETPSEPEQSPSAPPQPSTLDGTVDEVKAALPSLTANELTTLRQQEVDGKNRKGVLDAIDARLAELAAG